VSAALLREVCDARSVQRVAMVDDIFNVPAVDKLDRNAFSAFRAEYNGNADLRRTIGWVAGKSPDSLNQFDDLDDDELRPIWKALWHSQLGGRRLNPTHANIVRELFTQHGDDVLGMLDLVVNLLSLFKRDLGRTVTVHGTDYDADEVAKADIVLVDFFLETNIDQARALELSTEAVRNITEAARRAHRAPPSYLLISSRPEEVEIDKFRERSKLMKSRFRFFSKEALTGSNVDKLVNLHDLVDASDRAGVVESLLDDWRAGATAAVEAVHERMLELDIADLVYLDCFRLTHEGVTIANYLRWFLTASLHAKVTGTLDKKIWRKGESLKLFSVLDDNGELDSATLVKTFDGPSDAIARAYGDILFDSSRGAGDDGFPSPLAMTDLIEGDLFVKPKGRDRKGFDGAEVRIVMTPSCDLLPRSKGAAPAAKTVLLVPGRLHVMSDHDLDKDVANFDFVRLKERGEWRTFQLKWDYKNPISLEWSTITSDGVSKGFRRLGRVRDLYFHKIREQFASLFTRIGTEVPPLFPRPRSGRVLMAVTQNGSRRFEPVIDFKAADGLVWELGPVTLNRNDGKSQQVHLYQGSRKLAQRTTAALANVPAQPEPQKAAAERCLELLGDMDTYMDLLRPMKAGNRGTGDRVDFKKAGPRSAQAPTSANADIIVATYHD